MKAEVLTIGDELLRGEIVDSNKSFLSERLLSLEIETRWHTSVADDPGDMSEAFQRAAARSEVVLVSGGLGPTRDDLTIEVLAEAFGRKLVLHEPSLAAIRAFFQRFGREMAPNNAKQAYLPEGGEVLPNPVGTAPGCLLEQDRTLFFCMPGVPRELRLMMEEQVLPRLAARHRGGAVVRARLLRTFGMGESNLDEMLGDVAGDDVTLGFRTAFPDNYVRPVARGASREEAEERLARACQAIRERLGPLVYGEGEQTLEDATGALLRRSGRSVAVAESCTGGLLAQRFTSVPGASDYFLGGVVAYANDAKASLLGVSPELLEAHGAVSEPVARAMAEGVRERLGADYGLSTTGISGPTGASSAKPVGLVHVALAGPEGTEAGEFVFPVERESHRQITSSVCLDWVRRTLLGVERTAPRYLRRGS
ncbi:MAG: competence/damage-inducible protein A [Myxococcota bacterium]